MNFDFGNYFSHDNSLENSEEKSLEYKALRCKVEDMLNVIKDAGLNIFNYEDVLKSIKNRLNESLNKGNYLDNSYLNDCYNDAINELKKLEGLLLKYDMYIKAVNLTKYINAQLDKEKDNINKNNIVDLSSTQIDDLVYKMIEILDYIRKLDIDNLGNENEIIDEIYNTAYKIIKFEVLTKFESRLYDYVSYYQIDMSYLNKVVQKKIKSLDLNNKKYDKLNEKLFRLNSMGLNNIYFDLEVVKLLLLCNNEFSNSNNISTKLNIIMNDTCELLSRFNHSIDNLFCYRDNSEEFILWTKDFVDYERFPLENGHFAVSLEYDDRDDTFCVYKHEGYFYYDAKGNLLTR